MSHVFFEKNINSFITEIYLFYSKIKDVKCQNLYCQQRGLIYKNVKRTFIQASIVNNYIKLTFSDTPNLGNKSLLNIINLHTNKGFIIGPTLHADDLSTCLLHTYIMHYTITEIYI